MDGNRLVLTLTLKHMHTLRLICLLSLSDEHELEYACSPPFLSPIFACTSVELLLFVRFDFVPYGHGKRKQQQQRTRPAKNACNWTSLPYHFIYFERYACACSMHTLQSIASNGILISNRNAEANFSSGIFYSICVVFRFFFLNCAWSSGQEISLRCESNELEFGNSQSNQLKFDWSRPLFESPWHSNSCPDRLDSTIFVFSRISRRIPQG